MMGKRPFAMMVSTVISVTFVCASFALPLDPPVEKPSWWTHPPDSLTRLQYHSFLDDPDQGTEPDYTEDGYTPDFSDDWTISTGTYNQNLSGKVTQDATYGDNIAVLLTGDRQFDKYMGNSVLLPEKKWFVEIVWTPWAYVENGIPPINSPGLDVQVPPSHNVTGDGGGLLNTTRKDDWWLTRWSGSIEPQPQWEKFVFTFYEDTYVDSVWIGTHCVPEPSTLLLLGLGGIGLLRRRKSA